MPQGAGSATSPANQPSKRETEHDGTGGDSKRLHSDKGEIAISHGDVVPRPQAVAGDTLQDDTPLENTLSPNKIARHDDGPGGVTLLGQVLKLEHLDIEPEVFLEEQEVDTVLQFAAWFEPGRGSR